MNDLHEAQGANETPQQCLAVELRRLRLQAGLSVRASARGLHRAHSGSSSTRPGSVEVVEQYEEFFCLTRGTLAALRERGG